jgi:phospholipase/carboxylesterase
MTRRFPANFWSLRPRSADGLAGGPSGFDGLSHRLAGFSCDVPAGTACSSTATEAAEPVHPAGRPLSLFVPEHYEPNYAYPLIVWLHGAGGSERELAERMPHVSTRNYLGLALRGPLPSSSGPDAGGFRWSFSERALADLEGELHETVRRLRRRYHVHSERVFPVGFDEGGTVALQLLLRRPEWFGGAVALAARLPEERRALKRFGDLRDRRVLIAAGSRDRVLPVDRTLRTIRLLHAAGMHVSTRIIDAAHEATPRMLGHVNHWIMDGVCAAVSGAGF